MPGSNYIPGSVPNCGARDSGDFLDVLNPNHVEPKNALYGPAGAFVDNTNLVHFEGYDGPDIWCEHEGSGSTSDGMHGHFSYAFLCNAYFVKEFYNNVSTHLDDLPVWTLVIDYTPRRITGEYVLTNRPETAENWGNCPALGIFRAIPDGTNKCTFETELGYRGCLRVPGSLRYRIVD